MELKDSVLQQQYDKIRAFFKTTSEPFDDLEWDGENLVVYYEDVAVEHYTYADLKELIENFDCNA
jgi:hypothetical protein